MVSIKTAKQAIAFYGSMDMVKKFEKQYRDGLITHGERYNKIVDELKSKINNYKKYRQEKIDSVSKKKIDATSKLLKEITPILTDFSKKNKISLILKKKDIVLGRTDLEITNAIIEIVNSKVKKISLN